MRKRMVACIAFLLLVTLCAGCATSVELSERGIVGALGIDYANDVYRVSVLTFNPDLMEDANAAFDVAFSFGEGQDLYDAFEDARQSTSKKLFFGHNTVLVLGRNLVEHAILDTVTYLSHNKETRLNISVFMADGKAEEIIKLKTSDKAHISGSLEKLADGAPNGVDVKVQLFQILQELPDRGVKGILPVVRSAPVQNANADDADAQPVYDIVADQLAILDNNALLDTVSGDVMTGICLLQDRVKTLNLSVKLEDGTRAYAALSRPSAHFSAADTVNFRAQIVCTGSLAVVGESAQSGSTSLQVLKGAFEREAAYQIHTAYAFVTDELKTDLFDVQWYFAQAGDYTAAAAYFAGGSIPEADISCTFTVTG